MGQLFEGTGTILGQDFEFRCKLVNDTIGLPHTLIIDHVEDAVKLYMQDDTGKQIMSFKVIMDDDEKYYSLLPTLEIQEDLSVDVMFVMIATNSYKELTEIRKSIYMWAGAESFETMLNWCNPELN